MTESGASQAGAAAPDVERLIERLRVSLNPLCAAAADALSAAHTREAALRAENETLRCERDAANAHARENSLEERDLRAHVARLEAALKLAAERGPQSAGE